MQHLQPAICRMKCDLVLLSLNFSYWQGLSDKCRLAVMGYAYNLDDSKAALLRVPDKS